MLLQFLGTSSGVPTQQRNVSALVVKLASEKSWYLVDCGEATQHQLLRTPFSLASLAAIFITHVHGDHCFGLPGLLASATLAGRTKELRIVGPPEIETWVKDTLSFSHSRLSYPIEFISVENLKQINCEDFMVEPVRLSHRVASHAYVFNEIVKERKIDVDKLTANGIPAGPLWGELQAGNDVEYDGRTVRSVDYILAQRKSRKVIIGGDNDKPELLKNVVDHADLLIHETTYTESIARKVGSAPQHSYAKQVAAFAEHSKLANFIATHFSSRYIADPSSENSINLLRKEIEMQFNGTFYLAEDFDCFELDKQGVLSLHDKPHIR